jgi:hypothetical protein
MGGHRTVSGVSKNTISPPVHYYRTTVITNPVSAGNYYYDGEFNGKPSYKCSKLNLFLFWYLASPSWIIYPVKGEVVPGGYRRVDLSPIGVYLEIPPYVGSPIMVMLEI